MLKPLPLEWSINKFALTVNTSILPFRWLKIPHKHSPIFQWWTILTSTLPGLLHVLQTFNISWYLLMNLASLCRSDQEGHTWHAYWELKDPLPKEGLVNPLSCEHDQKEGRIKIQILHLVAKKIRKWMVWCVT